MILFLLDFTFFFSEGAETICKKELSRHISSFDNYIKDLTLNETPAVQLEQVQFDFIKDMSNSAAMTT